MGSKFGILAETGNNIQTEGLIDYWDAAYKKSYISGSTLIYNLASGSLTPTGSLKDNTGFVGLPTASWTFDGVDDYIEVANPFNSTDNSVCAWVYNESLVSDRTIVGYWSGQYLLYMDTDGVGDGYRVLYVTNAGNRSTSADNVNAIQDQWQYVVSTFTSTSVSLYVDGELIETVTGGAVTLNTTTANIAIGADYPNGGRDFYGNIANVQIYNRALTAADVLQNYNAQKDRFGL